MAPTCTVRREAAITRVAGLPGGFHALDLDQGSLVHRGIRTASAYLLYAGMLDIMFEMTSPLRCCW